MSMSIEDEDECNFITMIKKHLPNTLIVDGINYKLYVGVFLSGDFSIIYAEHIGDFFDWGNKLIDLFYSIVDILPSKIEYNEGESQDGTIYKTNIDEVISDCLDRLKVYVDINIKVTFEEELETLLNRYSKENGSNTPDYLFLEYLIKFLKNFNYIIK